MFYRNKKIDVHHHFIPHFYRSALEAKGVAKSGGMTIKKWNPESNLRMMDRLGIQVAIGSISEPALEPFSKDEAISMARQINEYSAKLIAQYPERYGAFAILPMPNVDAALEELAYALDVLKLDGVNLLTNYDDQYVGNTVFNPIFEELNKRKAVVHLHPSSSAKSFRRPEFLNADFMAEFTFNTTRAATNLILGGTMKRCPNISIILSHGGGTLPFLQERITGAQLVLQIKNGKFPDLIHNTGYYMKQFYYDTALATSKTSLMGLSQITSKSHLLYGSDANFAPEYAGLVMNVQLRMSDKFDKASYQDVMHNNALKLFPRLRKLFGNNIAYLLL